MTHLYAVLLPRCNFLKMTFSLKPSNQHITSSVKKKQKTNLVSSIQIVSYAAKTRIPAAFPHYILLCSAGMPVECRSSLGWQRWQGKEEDIWMQTGVLGVGRDWFFFFPSHFNFPWTRSSHSCFAKWYRFFFFFFFFFPFMQPERSWFSGKDDSMRYRLKVVTEY